MQSTDIETLHDDFPAHMAGNLLEYVLLVKDSLGIVELFVEGIELTPDLRLGTVPTRNSTQHTHARTAHIREEELCSPANSWGNQW